MRNATAHANNPRRLRLRVWGAAAVLVVFLLVFHDTAMASDAHHVVSAGHGASVVHNDGHADPAHHASSRSTPRVIEGDPCGFWTCVAVDFCETARAAAAPGQGRAPVTVLAAGFPAPFLAPEAVSRQPAETESGYRLAPSTRRALLQVFLI
jgi:hypothetical protein